MKNIIMLFIALMFLVGCKSNVMNEENIVTASTEEVKLTLQTNKTDYKSIDEIIIKSSIEYIGSDGGITILSGNTPLLIDIIGIDNDFKFLSTTEDIEAETYLALNKPYEIVFNKNGDLLNEGNEDSDDFFNSKELKLKKGIYEINISTALSFKGSQKPLDFLLTQRIYVE